MSSSAVLEPAGTEPMLIVSSSLKSLSDDWIQRTNYFFDLSQSPHQISAQLPPKKTNCGKRTLTPLLHVYISVQNSGLEIGADPVRSKNGWHLTSVQKRCGFLIWSFRFCPNSCRGRMYAVRKSSQVSRMLRCIRRKVLHGPSVMLDQYYPTIEGRNALETEDAFSLLEKDHSDKAIADLHL